MTLEFIMSPPTPDSAVVPGYERESPASGFRRIVRKSVLLNVVIVLTSFPVLVIKGGPRAVVPALIVMAGITLVIWTATFTMFSCLTIGRLVVTTFSARARRKPPVAARRVGVADHWLDGPG